MSRPEKIRILGKPFKVLWPESIEHDGDSDIVGLSDPDAQQITVKSTIALEMAQDALLHEVMHSVEASMGLDLEDTVIERLATGLLAVIKDNPGFVAYLRKKT